MFDAVNNLSPVYSLALEKCIYYLRFVFLLQNFDIDSSACINFCYIGALILLYSPLFCKGDVQYSTRAARKYATLHLEAHPMKW